MKENMQEMRIKHKDFNPKQIMKKCSTNWADLTDEQRKKYVDLSRKDKNKSIRLYKKA